MTLDVPPWPLDRHGRRLLGHRLGRRHDAGDHPAGGVVRRGRRLVDEVRPVGIREHEVGERAPDVYTDQPHASQSSLVRLPAALFIQARSW
jgi:hypothetical protein